MAGWLNPNDPNSGAALLTQEQLERQQDIAAKMLAAAGKARPMTSPWQAVAQAAEGAFAGLRQRDATLAAANAGTYDAAARADLAGSSVAAPAVTAAPVSTSGLAGASPVVTGSAPAGATPEIKEGLAKTAAALKVDPVDLATLVSYETAGTFDPTKRGPTTQWGQHRGLIQFGEPQAKEHGVDWANPVKSQLGPDGAIVKYFQKNGAQPGMGLLDLYSIVNAGGPGRYNASDANNGGAPGTVRDKVEKQMQGHRAKAQALFTANADLPDPTAAPIEAATGQPGFAVPGAAERVAQAMQAPQAAAMPDLSNTNDAGARILQVLSEQQRQGQAPAPGQPAAFAAPAASTPLAPASLPAANPVAPPSPVQRVAQAMPPVAGVASAPPQAATALQGADPKKLVGYATSPYVSPQTRAIATMLLKRQQDEAEYNRPETAEKRRLDIDLAKKTLSKSDAPTAVQEFEYGQKTPGFTDWKQAQSKAGASNVNVDVKGAGKFSEKANELQAKRYGDMATAADEGVALRGDVETLTSLLEGVNTGRGAEAKLGIAQMAKGLGLDGVADSLTGGKMNEMEAAQSIMDRLTPRMRVPGSGATSDMEMRTFRNSIPSLGKQPGGNKIIADTFRGMLDHQAQAGAIAGKALRGEISQSEADEALKSLPSPFTRYKEMQKAGEAPVKVATPEEARKLPKGTRIILPDGGEGIVP